MMRAACAVLLASGSVQAYPGLTAGCLNNCSQHGYCAGHYETYFVPFCYCSPGWAGDDCSEAMPLPPLPPSPPPPSPPPPPQPSYTPVQDPDDCNRPAAAVRKCPDGCVAHGRCDFSTGQCLCWLGWSGAVSEISYPREGPAIASAPSAHLVAHAWQACDLGPCHRRKRGCSGHGRCASPAPADEGAGGTMLWLDGVCVCDDGWSGEACDVEGPGGATVDGAVIHAAPAHASASLVVLPAHASAPPRTALRPEGKPAAKVAPSAAARGGGAARPERSAPALAVVEGSAEPTPAPTVLTVPSAPAVPSVPAVAAAPAASAVVPPANARTMRHRNHHRHRRHQRRLHALLEPNPPPDELPLETRSLLDAARERARASLPERFLRPAAAESRLS